MKSVKPYVAVGSILVVMLAFQNCGPAAGINSFAGSELPTTAFAKSSVAEYSAVVLTDPSNAQSSEIDIASGEVRGFDQRGIANGKLNCLSDRDRSALQEVLANAEVCEPLEQAAAGDRCLMMYEYPYAQLKGASREQALGEKHSGCEVPPDLCGEKAKALRALAVTLLARIPSSSCGS